MKGKWVEYTYRCRFFDDISGFFCELPKIPIELSLGGKIFPTDGVIDSGCSRTHIRRDIAEFFAIDTSRLERATTHGIAGSEEGFLQKITLSVINHGKPFEVEALIVGILPVPVLLGTNDFFTKIDVRFERSKQHFYVKRVQE